MLQTSAHSVETRQSWTVASVVLVILGIAFGGPWIVAVALKDIAAEFGGERSVPALASSLAWFGAGFGGIVWGAVAERVGVRWTVFAGGIAAAGGLALATSGPAWAMYVGYGALIGFVGLGGSNAPFYIYISRWFDRRRGSALALISSGGYIAGAVWPPIFERVIAAVGWRDTMLLYGALELVTIVPLALIFLRRPPETPRFTLDPETAGTDGRVLGWPPNLVFAMLAAGIFLCCTTMSMPQAHLVAFCGDLGISAAHGAAMLSVLLGTAFLSRQVWGLISDRIGGLATVLLSSSAQACAMTAFLLTQDELGLFTVAAGFGLGFSGLIPANIMSVRELFPAREAYWRIPIMLLCSGSGMATGGWLAGAIYDHYGFYAPAFATGIAVNLLNLTIIGTLVMRQRWVAVEV